MANADGDRRIVILEQLLSVARFENRSSAMLMTAGRLRVRMDSDGRIGPIRRVDDGSRPVPLP
jgi:hypothetical protein